MTSLEGRVLLSGGPEARWIGQDLNDLVGPSSVLGGDDVQDIHIGLTGLPASRTIAWARIEALGGGEWQYRGPWGPWAAAIVRDPGSTTAEVFVDPYQQETGRPFSITIAFDDGTTARADFPGGAADPNLRMPSASAALAWVGQEGRDFVGPGPAVGPDGVQDIRLTLGNLSGAVPIASVTIASSSGARWASGTNPEGLADLAVVRDGDRADLYLNPQGDPTGQTFTATILYANGKVDVATVAAQGADPALAQPSTAGPVPAFRQGVTATWIGQDGRDDAGPGSARVALNGLPSGLAVVAAALSDPARGLWSYRRDAGVAFHTDPHAKPLSVIAQGGRAEVAFAPDRDESGGEMTLRLVFDDGTQAVARFPAGATDPGRRAPRPAATSIVARPGDDLADLAGRFGTVRLSAGVYPLSGPLVLDRAVSLVADPGATLLFSQGAADPAWSAAIKVRSGHTTLDGFAVRFATPIRWAEGVSFGPAVIGTTDNLDSTSGTPLTGLVFSRLDLESPPVEGPTAEAPRLIRLASALDGRIEGNRLKGGTVEFVGGPWTIVGNAYIGTVPNTYSWTAFAGHETHDLVLSGNTAQPVGPSGRTWRFLVLTGTGSNDTIAGNVVVGIGPRDGDTQDQNAAEIILTESYRIDFEGMPSSISADGLVLQIPEPQGGPARTGAMVAILSGPEAGGYRRIAQAIGPRTYLLDAPLPRGSYAISIASGFVGQTFRGNTIDTRGSSAAGNLILVGNHFGTTVSGNHLLGGRGAFKVSASATEGPVAWGWSHSPFLGSTIEGNRIEDALLGATVSVEHTAATKSNAGRVYLSGTLANNVVAWSPAFLAARGGRAAIPGLIVGEGTALDPGELRLATSGNSSQVPAGSPLPTLHVLAANVDGRSVRDEVRPLGPPALSRNVPPAPTGLALVNDTGLSNADRETADGRVRFDPVPGAAGYEYLVSGATTTFAPVGSPGGFLPAGLTPVSNTIIVRAFDAEGRRSPEASFQFLLDNAPPIATGPFLSPSDDTGVSAADRITRAAAPRFGVTGDPTDTMILLRNGVEIDRRIGPGTLRESVARPDGAVGYSLRRVDAAGNYATSATLLVTIDTAAPGAVPGLSVASDGRVSFGPTSPDDRYEYRVGEDARFEPLDRRTAFSIGAAQRVGVRAVDAAGNAGPETWASVGAPTPAVGAPAPAGVWHGQDGRDVVGPFQEVRPDGIQDVHIALSGLKADRAIVFVDVQGLGGSQWQFGGPRGSWKAQLVRQAGSTSADLYVHPDRIETGRPFGVTVRYDDGTTASFWINGGVADPAKKAPGAQAVAGGATPSGPVGKRKQAAARRAARKAALARAKAERLRARAIARRQARVQTSDA